MDLLKNPRIRTRKCIHCGAVVLEAIAIDARSRFVAATMRASTSGIAYPVNATFVFERENGDDCPACKAELYPAAKVCLLGEVID